jgi:CIC family chloride channel protein
MGTRLQHRLKTLSERLGFERDWYLIIVGAAIGGLTAIGAVAFAQAIDAVDHLCRNAQQSLSPWFVGLLPMAGALVCGLLVHNYCADARGHGIPQVMTALLRNRGVIPLRVGVVKVLTAIATVGSGGSAGVEGPIVQTGSTVGSYIGQRLHVPRREMETLVGCGAAAAISSIFNAPIAGVIFVLEILLRDFSLRTFAPIVIASVLSNATTMAILDAIAEGEQVNRAIFDAGDHLGDFRFSIVELPAYFLLGIACAMTAVVFQKAIHAGEDFIERSRVHPIFQPVVGAACLGVLGTIYVLIGGYFDVHDPVPAFFGNGYETIAALLNPDSYLPGHPGVDIRPAIGLLALLVVFKILGTTFTIGSGGSGGVFAPSLFIGAGVGAVYGLALDRILPMPDGFTPAAYALVGMAAVLAASTHAPFMAILMLFELTRNVYVLLPIMFAAVVATVVSQLVERDSIYTAKLRRAGVIIGRTRDQTLLRHIPVESCQITPLPPEPVFASDPLSKLITLHAYHSVPDFVVVEQDGRYMGLVTGTDMRAALIDREAIPLLLVAELVRTDLPTIDAEENLDTVMDKFARHDVSSLPVMRAGDPAACVGLLTRAKLLARYQQAIDEA